MYTIQVRYISGDSFHSEEDVSEIGLVWEREDLAQRALTALSEHYKLYTSPDCYIYGYNKHHEDWYKKFISYDWCVNKNYKKHGWSAYQCGVEMDDGSVRTLPTGMWCGYFEKLLEADVVSLSDKNHIEF